MLLNHWADSQDVNLNFFPTRLQTASLTSLAGRVASTIFQSSLFANVRYVCLTLDNSCLFLSWTSLPVDFRANEAGTETSRTMMRLALGGLCLALAASLG